MKKALFLALVAALALVCTVVSCQKEGQNGVYGCSVSGEASSELMALADEMNSAVKSAVGAVSVRSSSLDSKAISAAQAVVDSKSSKPSGTIILYFAPSSKLGEPDAKKVTLKTWKL